MSAANLFPTDGFAQEDWMALLDVSLAGIGLVRPVYGLAGAPEPVAFATEYLNPAAQRMAGQDGQPAGDLLGHLLPAAAADLLAYYRQVFGAGEQPPYTVHYQYAGQACYLRLAARRVGQRLVVSFLDASDFDQSAAELALRESRAREQLARREAARHRAELQRLFAQAPVAIAILRGPRHLIELANPTMCALWGRAQAQALGAPLFELLPELAGQGFEQLLDEVVATGAPYVAHERPARLDRYGSSETGYWNFVYQPLREADGTITGVAVVAAEITDQVLGRQQVQQLNDALRRSNADLHASNQRLVRTNADLDNFVYTASHDLWNPISNIEGLLAALRLDLNEAADEAAVAELLDLMQESVDRFKRTIRDLTNMARLQPAAPPPAQATDLAQVIEEVRLDLGAQLDGATLTVEVSACPTLRFAEKTLRSIVYNLLSNGLRYRHPDRPPRLLVRCYTTPDAHVLSVQDNGLGLDTTQPVKLHGLFQRQHDHADGTGAGLYLVKKLLEDAGGTIEVESEVGVGSTFLAYFPRSRQA